MASAGTTSAPVGGQRQDGEQGRGACTHGGPPEKRRPLHPVSDGPGCRPPAGVHARLIVRPVRVDVVGGPTVTGPGGSLSGRRLGGRRAHIVLVALALEGGTLSGDRLADLVWEGGPPATWPAALRGVVGGLRAVLRGIGIDDQALLTTVPGGYRLAPDTAVDVREAEKVLDRAQDLDPQRPAAGGPGPARTARPVARRRRPAGRRRGVAAGAPRACRRAGPPDVGPRRRGRDRGRASIARPWRRPSSGWRRLPWTSGRTEP